MKKILLVFLVVFCTASSKVLSRRKRYLVFPEGSSLSIAICMTAQTDITPGEIFTEGVNWGISYDLPNDTKQFKELYKKPKDMMQMRHRRDLYTKLERIMDSMGYSGRNCVLRALCEASRNFKPKGESLIDEVLRIVFGYPENNGEEMEYFSISSGSRECHDMYPRCPFSLIDLALGYYSTGLPPDV